MISNLKNGKIILSMNVIVRLVKHITDDVVFTKKGLVPIKKFLVSDGYEEIPAIIWGNESKMLKINDSIHIISGHISINPFSRNNKREIEAYRYIITRRSE